MAVAAAGIALWLVGGIGAVDVVRYLGYEAGFVVLPGYLVLRALLPTVRSRALLLALGWPVGLTLEVLAFSLTAALGVRDLFVAYPLVVGIPALLALARHRGEARTHPFASLFSPGSNWTTAGLCLLAFTYFGVAYYTALPLPGSANGVSYPADVVFYLAISGDALHHWPPQSPGLAGEPFGYHYFAYFHMAAAAQVTGISLPSIVFRLYLVPLTALLTLQVAVAGRLLTGLRWAGPLAVALFLLIRAIDLSIADTAPFAGLGMFHLAYSPSQLLGMAIFVPILIVLTCLLDPAVMTRISPESRLPRANLWVVLVILLVGAGGAKTTILPVLIGGLAIYLVWGKFRGASLDRTAVGALGLCVVIYLAYLAVLYGGSKLGLRFDVMSTLKEMATLVRVHSQWPETSLGDWSYWVMAVPVGTVMFFAAPVAGLLFALTRSSRQSPSAVLSVSLLLAGIPAFFFLHGDFLEQLYFTLYGLIAIFPVAAGGLIRYFQSPEQRSHIRWSRMIALGVVWTLALVGLALLTDRIAAKHPIRADLLLYMPLVLIGIALLIVAVRAGTRLRAQVACFAVLALLLTAALDTPLDVIPSTVRRLQHGESLYDVSTGGVHSRQLQGMRWMRDHLPDDSVLSVSNDLSPRTRSLGPLDLTYPAFTEHRAFLEGWVFTTRANEIGARAVMNRQKDPFPERRALERAAIRHADRAALRTMIDDYGVTHIVVSKKDGVVNPGVYRLGRRVYSNGAIDVIQVAPALSGQR